MTRGRAPGRSWEAKTAPLRTGLLVPRLGLRDHQLEPPCRRNVEGPHGFRDGTLFVRCFDHSEVLSTLSDVIDTPAGHVVRSIVLSRACISSALRRQPHQQRTPQRAAGGPSKRPSYFASRWHSVSSLVTRPSIIPAPVWTQHTLMRF